MAAKQHSEFRTDQLAPHSVEAEEAVLGAILISPDAIYEVSFLNADDFFIVRLGWIFGAMKALHTRHEPIDYLTVVTELEQAGKLKEIGGASYLLGLINKTPSALYVEGYGRIVERMAFRRRLINAAGQMVRVAHSDEPDITVVKANADQIYFDATDVMDESTDSTMQELIGQDFDTLQATINGAEVAGVKTGMVDIDNMIAAMRDGEFILVAARPGMGKSSWMQTVTENAAKVGKSIGMFSLEMKKSEVTRRFVAAESGIPFKRLQEGKLQGDEWDRYMTAIKSIGQWRVVIDDRETVSPADIRSKARRWVAQHEIDLLIVDYIQLVNGGSVYAKKDNRVNELGFISRQLKMIARELGIPVIAAAQLNRDVEKRSNKRPQLSDLRESGTLEQDTDLVLFIYRDSYYYADSPSGNITEIHIAKQRNGPTGMVETLWMPERMRFENAIKIDLDKATWS
jgi:replicative DNA helicase